MLTIADYVIWPSLNRMELLISLNSSPAQLRSGGVNFGLSTCWISSHDMGAVYRGFWRGSYHIAFGTITEMTLIDFSRVLCQFRTIRPDFIIYMCLSSIPTEHRDIFLAVTICPRLQTQNLWKGSLMPPNPNRPNLLG